MDNDLSSGEFEKTYGAHYVRGKMGNKVIFEEDSYRSARAEDDMEEEEWKTCLGDIMVSLGETHAPPLFLRLTLLIITSPQNQPLLSVHPGVPGAVLVYVSKRGGKGSKLLMADKHLPQRRLHTPGFGVTQVLPEKSGFVWINSAAVAHQTLAHDLSLVKGKIERAKAQSLAKLLEKNTKSVVDYWDRLQTVKGGCPLQSCCAKQDLHSTFKGGKTVYNNFTPVNELRELGRKRKLLNFNDESEKNRVIVWSVETKEHGHVRHAAVEDGSGGVKVFKAASIEWPC